MAGAFLYIGNISVFFRLMAMALIGITMTWMTSCQEGKPRIQNGYLELAKQHPDRMVVVDGTPDPKVVSDTIWEHLKAKGLV